MKNYKKNFSRSSTRLQNWDYSWKGDYFITICVKDRNHYFGKIINGIMQLNELGIVANNEWLKTPVIRPDMNIKLGEFVVMPNHFHGILIIGENEYNARRGDMKQQGGDMGQHGDTDAMHGVRTETDTDAMHGVPTETETDADAIIIAIENIIHSPNTICNTNSSGPKNKFGPQSKNLASIIRGYKSAVTTYARKNNIIFQWQGRFYDHKIRSLADYVRISDYIRNNPANFYRKKLSKE